MKRRFPFRLVDELQCTVFPNEICEFLFRNVGLYDLQTIHAS